MQSVFRPVCFCILWLFVPVGQTDGQNQQTDDVSRRIDLTFWESIKDSHDAALFEDYLSKFPSGVFVNIAKARLRELRSDQLKRPSMCFCSTSSGDM